MAAQHPPHSEGRTRNCSRLRLALPVMFLVRLPERRYVGRCRRGNPVLTEREVRLLLQRLCADLGFCVPPAIQQQFVEHPPSTVREFTDAVFVAEGLDPSAAPRHLYRQVQALVAGAFVQSEMESELDTPE